MQNNFCQLNVSQKRINIRGQNSVPQAALKPPQLSSLKLRECLIYQRTKYPFCNTDFLTDCSETFRRFLFLKMSLQNQEESMYSEDQLKLMQEVPAEMDFNTDVNFCNMETMVQADNLKNTSLTLPKPAAKTSPSPPNLGSTLCSLPSFSLDPSASTSPLNHPPSPAHPASNDVHHWPASRLSSIVQSNLSRRSNTVEQFRGFLKIMEIVAPTPEAEDEMFGDLR